MEKTIGKRKGKGLNRIYEKLIDSVFPRRCPVCDDAVPHGQGLICDECREELKRITEPYCIKCGRPVRDDTVMLCPECSSNGAEYKYERGRAVYEYDEVLKDSIYRFKYGGRREYAEFYARSMADVLGDQILKWKPQALVPIPVHKSRLKKRGYNQAGLLAEELSKIISVPVRDDILIRVEKTRVQKDLSALERQNNLKKALKITHYDVKLKNIVLIDDIYTTGSTINAAASGLRMAGVANIYYAVIGAAVND